MLQSTGQNWSRKKRKAISSSVLVATVPENLRNSRVPFTLFLFFIICAWPSGFATTVRNTRKTHRRLFNVTREYNSGDSFSNLHLLCHPEYCYKFGANTKREKFCLCQCPISKPIFLQHTQNCTANIDVCDKVLEFRSENETFRVAPTLFLPLQNQILNPGAQLNWDDAEVKLNGKGKAPCSAQVGGILTEQGWVILQKKLFHLHVVNAGTFFKWLGDEDDSRFLQGKLVQIPLHCKTKNGRQDMCAAFRVMGNDVMATPLVRKVSPNNPVGGGDLRSLKKNEQNETGLIVGIACGALLAVTLVGVAIFWVQNRPIFHTGPGYEYGPQPLVVPQTTAIEMHPSSAPALHISTGNAHYRNCNGEVFELAVSDQAAINGWSVSDPVARGDAVELQPIRAQQNSVPPMIDQLPPPPPYPSNVKKKLYFSPEFFEPELMVDPPPLAEEFLYEVRRMIDLAKTRLRARRYIPRVPVIPEERAENSERSNPTELKAISEEENEDILEMEEIVGKISHPEFQEQEENEEEEAERNSPEGSGGSAESPDSGKTSGDGPAVSDGSKESATDKDSGFEDGTPIKKPRRTTKKQAAEEQMSSTSGATQEKVSHWLSRMPADSLEIEESPPTPRKPVRHSKLFNFFTARQNQAQASCTQGSSGTPYNNSVENGNFSLPSVGGVSCVTIGSENAATDKKTGKTKNRSSHSNPSSSALLKRYGINEGNPQEGTFQPSSTNKQDLWLQIAPEYISRQQILNSHNHTPMEPSRFTPPLGYRNSGITVASLPRQFMRNHHFQPNIGAGSVVFPNEKSLPFPDSFPRIHAANKYSKSRPEIQPGTYNSKPPASILPTASSQ